MAAGVPVPRWRIIRGNLTLHCGNPAETRQPPFETDRRLKIICMTQEIWILFEELNYFG